MAITTIAGTEALASFNTGRAKLTAQMNGARSKARYSGILQIPSGKADSDKNTWKLCM
jgi:hypothetical protein